MTRSLRSTDPALGADLFRVGVLALVAVLGLATAGGDFHVLFEEAGTLHDELGEAVHAESVHSDCDASGLHVERSRPAPHRHCPGCLLSHASRVDFGPPLALPVGYGARGSVTDRAAPAASRTHLAGPGPRAPPLA